MYSNNSCNNSQFESAMNFKNFETMLRRQCLVKPKVPCNSLQTKSIFSKMDNIFNPPFRILEKDAAGTQFEPKRPAEVSNLSSKIPILQRVARYLSPHSRRIAKDTKWKPSNQQPVPATAHYEGDVDEGVSLLSKIKALEGSSCVQRRIF